MRWPVADAAGAVGDEEEEAGVAAVWGVGAAGIAAAVDTEAVLDRRPSIAALR
jgi:hypothetical protein